MREVPLYPPKFDTFGTRPANLNVKVDGFGTNIVNFEPLVFRFYLTQCINQMVLESQLPPKNVNLWFQLVTVNNKLTILWGS